VDGKTTTDWSEGSCTHTNYSTDAWWRVDLGTSLPVAEVVIVNRECGSCGKYLSAFEIRIGNLILRRIVTRTYIFKWVKKYFKVILYSGHYVVIWSDSEIKKIWICQLPELIR